MTIKEIKDILLKRGVLKDTPNGIWVACSIKDHINTLCKENPEFEQKYKSYSSYEEFFVCLKNQVEEVPRCPYCEEKVSVSHRKFRDTCGKRTCYQRDHERIMTERYGVPFTWKVPKVKEKTLKTFKEKWGVDNAGQSKEIHEKAKKTLLENRGVEYSVLLPEVRESALKGNKRLKEDPEFRKQVVEKRKNTMRERYGCDHALQNKEILAKASNTMKEKLGVPWAQQNKDVQNKGVHTRLDKYGVEYCAQSEDYARRINRRYLYEGEYYDSSWEIAYLIYSKEVLKEEVYKNYDPVTLFYGDNIPFNYFPDFWNKTRNSFVEIKGDQFLDDNKNIIPFYSRKEESSDEYLKRLEKCKAKDAFIKEKGILLSGEDILPMIKYINDTRGKKFLKSLLVSSQES